MIFNIIVSIVIVSLFAFVLRQKKFNKKLDGIILVAGAGIIFIVRSPFIWIPVFLLVLLYFSISFLRHKLKLK